MTGIHRFLQGYEEFANRRVARETLKRLAGGQHPEAVVVSCSDSRVVPEQITMSDPGALFVVRNVANLIPPWSSGNQSVGAALVYAISELRVGHLIVLGHYGCGGMAAVRACFGGHAHDHAHDPALPAWLSYARDSWDELVESGHADLPDWHDRLVQENVLQQLANALDYPVVRAAVDAGTLQLHAWIYDMRSAELCFWDRAGAGFVRGDPGAGGGAITAAEVEEQDDV